MDRRLSGKIGNTNIDMMDHLLIKGVIFRSKVPCLVEVEIRGLSENRTWELTQKECEINGEITIEFEPVIIRVLVIRMKMMGRRSNKEEIKYIEMIPVRERI